MLGDGLFGAIDRVLGAFVGGAQALLVIWLTGGLLAAGPSPTLASQAQTSLFIRGLNGYLPAPTEIATALSRLLDDTAPAGPVRRLRAAAGAARRRCPTTRSSQQLAAIAAAEHGQGLGGDVPRDLDRARASSWTVATSSRTPTWSPARARSGWRSASDVYDAAPVLFDPDLDIALLYAPQVPGAAARALADRSAAWSDRRDVRLPGRPRPRCPAGRGRRAPTRPRASTSTARSG